MTNCALIYLPLGVMNDDPKTAAGLNPESIAKVRGNAEPTTASPNFLFMALGIPQHREAGEVCLDLGAGL